MMSLNRETRNQIREIAFGQGSAFRPGTQKVPTDRHTLHVIVGLGGCGCDMLRETKGLISRICRDDNDKTKPPRRVIYLGVDTDNSAAGPLRSGWKCRNGSTVRLNCEGQASETLELPCQHLRPMLADENDAINQNAFPHIFSWLDRGWAHVLTPGATGACGIRQAGRLCLFLSMESVLTKIQHVLTQASIGETIRNVNIYLLTGLCGGTGSGIYLDMAYILRRQVQNVLHLDAVDVTTCGYLMMPDVNLQNPNAWNYIPSNGYAALQELDYLMSLHKTGGRFQQDYLPGVFSVDTNEPPFDYVHLLSHKSMHQPRPTDYYGRLTAAVARNILGFLADDLPYDLDPYLNPGNAEPVMRQLYSHVPNIVNIAPPHFRPYPERVHYYLSIGSAEFALPQDDIRRYVLTLLFDGMDDLFQNEPDLHDAIELARDLGLEEHAWLSRMLADIPDPFCAGDADPREIFRSDARLEYENRLESALDAADTLLVERFVQFRASLSKRLEDLLEPRFTSLAQGPLWVSSLLVRVLMPYLKQERSCLDIKHNEHEQRIASARGERAQLARGFHTRAKARDFMQTWNDEFRAKVEQLALDYLYQDVDGSLDMSLCMTTYALREILRQSERRYGVIAGILDGIRLVSASSTDSLSTAQQAPGPLTWDAPTLSQVSHVVRGMFSRHYDVTALVQDFVRDILAASKDWGGDRVDVTGFLEQFFDAHLQQISTEPLEPYLEELFVGNGKPFRTLEDALTAPNGLFEELLQKSACQAMLSDDPQYMLVLSVPAHCQGIKNAARHYIHNSPHHMLLWESSMDSRICMHRVGCGIPLYNYTELPYYEHHYYNQDRYMLAGAHLRGSDSRDRASDWFCLPSPIPGRMRGDGVFACPPLLKGMEDRRRSLFRDLLATPAIQFVDGCAGPHEKDCVFYVSRHWDTCGVDQLLGTDSSGRVDYRSVKSGGWDERKIMPVLEELHTLRRTGLPPADGLMDAAYRRAPGTVLILRDCDRYIDPVLLAQDPDAARAAIAEEFFIASPALCVRGEKELVKYRRLVEHIAVLENALKELAGMYGDCEQMVMLLVSGLDVMEAGGMDLTCRNKMTREYELYRKLRAMKLSGSAHQERFCEDLTDQAAAALDAIRANGDPGKLSGLISKLDDLITEFRKKVTFLRTAQLRHPGSLDGMDIMECSRFYEICLQKAGEMMSEARYELFRVRKQAGKADPITGQRAEEAAVTYPPMPPVPFPPAEPKPDDA